MMAYFVTSFHIIITLYFRIPGIDEATALASAINHIESGKYDLIVFDTAPTGHTLKLLALPDIIQVNNRNKTVKNII